jgi:hypothetical protein
LVQDAHCRRVPEYAGIAAWRSAGFGGTTLTNLARLGPRTSAVLLAAACIASAAAQDIGQIKVARGAVTIERAGAALPATVGMRVQTADRVRTGGDGSVGITMTDNTLLSAGPNSILTLERFEFEPATRVGRFDASLGTGSLAVVSGHIAKQSPEAMTVRTPHAILGVRGTEFVVSTHDPARP